MFTTEREREIVYEKCSLFCIHYMYITNQLEISYLLQYKYTHENFIRDKNELHMIVIVIVVHLHNLIFT